MVMSGYRAALLAAVLSCAFALPVCAGDNAGAAFSLVGAEQTASVRPGERVALRLAAAGLQNMREIEISLAASSAQAFDLAATAYEIPVAWFVAGGAPAADESPALFSAELQALEGLNSEEKATIRVDKIAIVSLGEERDEFGAGELALELAVAPAQTAILGGGLPLAAMALGQNYPNPFNPETNIRFELSEASDVMLAVYDLAGQVVRTLVGDQYLAAGVHKVVWDGRNTRGEQVGSGVYFYQLRAGSFTAIKKMTLLQ
jgi:hypothetical protein